MQHSVYKSEEGRRAIQAFYRQVLDAAPVPLRTRFVPTSHGRTHLFEAGPESGDALLLLHGSASNSATWLGDVSLWSRSFRVIAVDLPGEPGLSEARRLVLASEEATTWLRSLLTSIAVERVWIVGMSLGGWIAIHFACRFPERVATLSLIAAAGLAPQRRSFLFKALPLLLLGDWGVDRVQRMVFGNAEVPGPVLEFARLLARHFRPVTEPVPVFSDMELRRLQMPIQYFGGTHDVLLRTEDSAKRLTRLLPHAEVHLLAGFGHAVLGQTETIHTFLNHNETQ